MQDEERPAAGATASAWDAVRWREFDQIIQEIKTLHADVPPEELQAAIDEASTAVRQEMWPRVTGKKETS